MKPTIISKVFIGVVYLINICCFAANTDPKPLVLNLALVDPGSSITIPGNRKFNFIVIENVINGYAYSVEIRNEPKMLPLLESKAGLLKRGHAPSEPCRDLYQKVMDLKAFQEMIDDSNRNERQLSDLKNRVNVVLRKNECSEDEVKATAIYWLESTVRIIQEKIEVETGRTVTIIVKRGTLEWKFIYEGDSPGKWVTTYGFGFTTNALRGNSYYTKQLPDTSVFEILKSRGPKAFDLSYVPAVFFTFFPSKRQSKCWNHSLTGGLGFDLVSPVLYFGYNGLYWHNIGFSAGLAFQQQNVLRDQFEVNEKVSMFMDTGQLHEKVYRPNLFISIHFRLDKDPYSKEEK